MKAPKFILSFIFILTTPVLAALELDQNASKLEFISVKKGAIAEISHFNKFSADLSDSGQISFTIDLTSVDTHIAVRDNRIRNFLFETIRFPRARFQGSVPATIYAQLKSGQFVKTVIRGSLYLHGLQKKITVPVKIIQLANGQLNIFNTEPYLLYANDFGLIKGIKKLKSLAKLTEINTVIPVFFDLYFG